MGRLLLIVWLALPFALGAQDSLFAFVDNPFSRRFAPEPVEGYKLEVAQRIFDDLVKTRGSFRMPVPELVMNTGRRYMAWMHPGKRQIGLEEQAYDICASLGEDSLNALAAMLSHEIIHYYENHDWKRNFINQNDGLEAAEQLEQLSDGLKYKTQADYFGGVLAILQKDTSAALAYFQSAQPEVMNLAKINLSVLQGGAELFAPQNYNVKGVEEIDGVFTARSFIPLTAPSGTLRLAKAGSIFPQSKQACHLVKRGA